MIEIRSVYMDHNCRHVSVTDAAAIDAGRYGVFLTRDAKQGELLISETPSDTVLYPNVLEGAFAAPAEWSREKWRKSFKFSTLQGFISVFAPTVSELNHDCSAPATMAYFPATKRVEVRANRYMRTGDEITVNYIAPRDWPPVTARRPALEKAWNFTCRCAACRGEDLQTEGVHYVARKRSECYQLQDMFLRLIERPLPSDAFLGFGGGNFATRFSATHWYLKQVLRQGCMQTSPPTQSEVPPLVDQRLVDAWIMLWRLQPGDVSDPARFIYADVSRDVYRHRATEIFNVLYGKITETTVVCKLAELGHPTPPPIRQPRPILDIPNQATSNDSDSPFPRPRHRHASVATGDAAAASAQSPETAQTGSATGRQGHTPSPPNPPHEPKQSTLAYQLAQESSSEEEAREKSKKRAKKDTKAQ
ncbi:MAG: hypothetical protein M1828_004706 [Chrysothrix sp. TS-e1954]|nr:MAG: hypothetical protein M1828_004706 [Chrysothrix sp. TS-e1954]